MTILSVIAVATITVVVVGVGAEEDAEPGLVVDGPAAGVGPAHVNAVREHKGAGQGVHHVTGCSVDETGHHLEADLLLGAVELLGHGGQWRQAGDEEEQQQTTGTGVGQVEKDLHDQAGLETNLEKERKRDI